MELFPIRSLQYRVNLACKPLSLSNVRSAGDSVPYYRESKGKILMGQDDVKDSKSGKCLGDCSAGVSPSKTAELVSGCSYARSLIICIP